jgi:membrane fusion protein, multidrug efflux system
MKTIGILVILIILLAAGCRSETHKTTSSGSTPVRVVSLEPEKISIPVHTTGILMPSEEIKLSFKIGGIVSGIMVKEGQKVKKGDILSVLNPSEINAQVSQAKSGYEKTLRDYNRAKNLYADTVATLEQMQNTITAMNVAKSNLEIAQFNQAYSKIAAPDNGVILKQFVKENELVSQGYPVFLFGTSGTYWKVKAGLSDRDIVKINQGDSASVTFDAWPAIKFPATVERIGEMGNPLTGTYEVEFTFRDEGHRLATGFVAGVDIFPALKESFFLVPVGAIIEAEGQNGYIYVVSDSMEVKKVKISITAILGSTAAMRTDDQDLKRVITEGAAYVREGEKVMVVR